MSRGRAEVDFKISRFTRLLEGTVADMTKKGEERAPAVAPAEGTGRRCSTAHLMRQRRPGWTDNQQRRANTVASKQEFDDKLPH
jgi:hypothetical protein